MAITLFDQAIYSGSNFFISVVIGRLCSKQELGLYLLGFTILVFMSNVQVALISSAYTVYYPKIKDENTRKAVSKPTFLLYKLSPSLNVQ